MLFLLMKSGRFPSFSVFFVSFLASVLYCHLPSYWCFLLIKFWQLADSFIILSVLPSFFPCTLYFNFFFVWVLWLIKFGRFTSFQPFLVSFLVNALHLFPLLLCTCAFIHKQAHLILQWLCLLYGKVQTTIVEI